MRAAFQNEPSLDFSIEENRAAMRDALKQVESQLGQRYPLIIGGERRETGQWITSTNPGKPDQVVGELPDAHARTSLHRLTVLDCTVCGEQGV